MGANYTFEGEISISPALNFAQIKEAQELAMKMLRPGFDQKHAKPETVFEGYMPLTFILDEFEKTTEEGVLKVVRAIGMKASHPTTGSLSYSMGDLLCKLAEHFEAHEFTGTVMALREDASSAVKVVCRAGKNGPSAVQETKGKTYVHWDDGSDNTEVSDIT